MPPKILQSHYKKKLPKHLVYQKIANNRNLVYNQTVSKKIIEIKSKYLRNNRNRIEIIEIES